MSMYDILNKLKLVSDTAALTPETTELTESAKPKGRLAETIENLEAQYEAVKNPYAVGMAQAMKSTGDEPPLEKSTIKKAHKIAKKVDETDGDDEEDDKSVPADGGPGEWPKGKQHYRDDPKWEPESYGDYKHNLEETDLTESKQGFVILDNSLIHKIANLDGTEVDEEDGTVWSNNPNVTKKLAAFAKANPTKLKMSSWLSDVPGQAKPVNDQWTDASVDLTENAKHGKDKMLTEGAIKSLFSELQSELNANPDFSIAVDDGNNKRAEILVRRELNHDERFNKLSHSIKEQLFDAAMEEYGFYEDTDNPFDISSDAATPDSDRPHNDLGKHYTGRNAAVHELDEIARLAGIATAEKVPMIGEEGDDDDFPPAPPHEEPIVLESDTVMLNGKPIDMDSLEFGGIHSWDAPDYSDAYIEYAEFEDGTVLTDDELDQLQDMYRAEMYAAMEKSLHESKDELEEDEVEEGNEFSGELAKAKAAGKDNFEVDGKTYPVKEDINVNITASGDEDSINLIRKLAGLSAGEQEHEMDIPAIAVVSSDEPVEEERDVEYTNTPNEKIASPEAAYPTGNDLHGKHRKSYSDKPYRGDNPMAVAEDKEVNKLWAKYNSMLKGITK